MSHKILLLSLALIAPWALRATPSTTQSPAPSVEDPATRSLDNDPDFKKLSPEMQERVRKFANELNEAIAAAKNDSAKDTPAKQPDSPTLKYTYAQAANTPPPPAAQPVKPSVPPPCAVPPKKPSLLSRLKKHAEQTLQKQAGKADAQIAKGTGGNVDAGVQDTTTTAVNQANQSDPCTPAKGQPAKQ